jgi:hypothetical protein
MSNDVARFIDWAAQIDGGIGEFHRYLKSNAKPVEVAKIADIPGASKVLAGLRPRARHCYKNATDAAWADDRIGYVEGMVSIGFPIDHAWNIWLPTGQHFDLTAERVKACGPLEEYVALSILTPKELAPLLLKDGLYGGIPRKQFIETRRSA